VFFIIFFGAGLSFSIIYAYKANKLIDQFIKKKIVFGGINFYDKNRILISSSSFKNSAFVSILSVPEKIQKTIISVEDKTFYVNKGISVSGFLRSLLYLPVKFFKGRLIGGGSTITQQVARTIFLDRQFSLLRKVKEAIISVLLNQKISKEEILELYFNKVYMGHGCYGIKTASKFFFDKNLDQLNNSEIACLIGLLKSPDYLSPVNNYENSLCRRNYVLSWMFKENIINKEEYEEAINSGISCTNNTENTGIGFNNIKKIASKYIVENFGEPDLTNETFDVITTIDLKMQNKAKEILKKYSIEYELKQPWSGPIERNVLNKQEGMRKLAKIKELCGSYFTPVLVIENDGSYVNLGNKKSIFSQEDGRRVKKGDIVITYKGKLCNLPQINGFFLVCSLEKESLGNMLVDLYSYDDSFWSLNKTKIPPASTMKILTTAFILENLNCDLTLPMEDCPGLVNLSDNSFSKIPLDVYKNTKKSNGNIWKPQNCDKVFLGNIDLRMAFEQSRNIPFIKKMTETGLDKYVKFLRKFGLNLGAYITTPIGAVELAPQNIIEVLATVGNDGKKFSTNVMKEIKKDGENIFKFKSQESEPLISKETVYMILDAMKGGVKRGTSKILKTLGMENIGAKTGTVSSHTGVIAVCIVKGFIILVGFCRKDGQKMLKEWGADRPISSIKDFLLSFPQPDSKIMDLPKSLEIKKRQFFNIIIDEAFRSPVNN